MDIEMTDVVAVAAHERVDWDADEIAPELQGHECAVVLTDAGNWVAVCDVHNLHVGEPVNVVQAMKSSKLKRPGRVWALWDGSKRASYWPPDIPKRMPIYMATPA